MNGKCLCKLFAAAVISITYGYEVSVFAPGKTIAILDNARIHHAKLLQPFIKENEHCLQLMFLPPYSPNLLFQSSYLGIVGIQPDLYLRKLFINLPVSVQGGFKRL